MRLQSNLCCFTILAFFSPVLLVMRSPLTILSIWLLRKNLTCSHILTSPLSVEKLQPKVKFLNFLGNQKVVDKYLKRKEFNNLIVFFWSFQYLLLLTFFKQIMIFSQCATYFLQYSEYQKHCVHTKTEIDLFPNSRWASFWQSRFPCIFVWVFKTSYLCTIWSFT